MDNRLSRYVSVRSEMRICDSAKKKDRLSARVANSKGEARQCERDWAAHQRPTSFLKHQGEVRVLHVPSENLEYTHVAVAGLGEENPESNDGIEAQKDNLRTAIAGMRSACFRDHWILCAIAFFHSCRKACI